MEAPNDVGMSRATRVLDTLKRLVAERPTLRTQTRALMHAARERTMDVTPEIKESEVKDFLSVDPVKQIYQKKEVEETMSKIHTTKELRCTFSQRMFVPSMLK